MAAPNPLYDFALETGNPTAANLNAAGGDLPIIVASTHLLVVAGDVATKGGMEPVAGGTYRTWWRQLDTMIFSACMLDDAAQLLGVKRAVMLAEAARLLRLAHEGGLSAAARAGGLQEVIADFGTTGRKLAQASPLAWTLGPGQFQTMPAVGVAHALPLGLSFWDEITLGMLCPSPGAPRGVAGLRAALPHCYVPASRITPLFCEPLEELADAVEEDRPGWQAIAAGTRQARLFSAFFLRKMPTLVPPFLIFAPPLRCFDICSRYRLKGEHAFPLWFVDAWRVAFKSLALLMGEATEGHEALGFTGRLMASTPEPNGAQALNDSVKLLLPLVDTAALRTASAGERVEAMVALIRDAKAGQKDPTTRDSTSQGLDSAGWARVFMLPAVSAMLALLEPLDVVPIVDYRVARVLLQSRAALGLQVVLNLRNPPNKTLRAMASACRPQVILEVFQRHLCVDAAGVLQQQWYESITLQDCIRIASGKWDVASAAASAAMEADAVDLWGIAAPLLRKLNGNASLDRFGLHPPAGGPISLFISEPRLRLASPIIVNMWEVIGYSGTAVGSVSSVLRTLRDYCDKIDSIPDSYSSARSACRQLLMEAGARFFHDSGLNHRSALSTPPEQATKPALLAPPENGGHAILADLDTILADTAAWVRKDELLARAVPDLVPGVPHGALSDSGAQSVVSLASIGPSASQLGLPTISSSDDHRPPVSAVGSAPGSVTNQATWQHLGSTLGAPPPPSLAGSMISPSLAGSLQSQQVPMTNHTSEWGSLIDSIQQDGPGFWLGSVWSGSSDPNFFIPPNTCPASFCPNTAIQHQYCIFTPGTCSHPPIAGQNIITTLLPPHHTTPTGSGGGGRGGGGGGGRGGGGGGGRGGGGGGKGGGGRHQQHQRGRGGRWGKGNGQRGGRRGGRIGKSLNGRHT